tara:strand:+ start:151 stop:348 length:198 start_codon:yes stop_codon:yes gene_type:complete
MPTKKKRTLNEYRQVKDNVYEVNKISHKITDDTEFTFSKKGLIKFLNDFEKTPESAVEFVNTLIP